MADDGFVALARRVLAGQCSLFVGAGASLSSGAPTSDTLAISIGQDVLRIDEHYPLADVVEFADGTVGRAAVQKVIRAKLLGLSPSPSVRELVKLPWARVYTVNFDDLIERAYVASGLPAPTIVAPGDALDVLDTGKTPIFMLHGTIKRISENGRGPSLVLTQEDLTRGRASMTAMLRQLTNDMRASEIVYIGFSLRDNDFRQLVFELLESVENQQMLIPRGYAVMPEANQMIALYWDTKKVQIIDATMEVFVKAVGVIRSGQAGVNPIAVGEAPLFPSYLREIHPMDPRSTEIDRAFEFPALDDGDADPSDFLRGGVATWPTIRDHYDASREITDDITELLIGQDDEQSEQRAGTRPTQFVLLVGHAGSGKTTVARRIAWELAQTWSRPVAWARSPARMEFDSLETVSAEVGRRLFVFVDDAADAGMHLLGIIRRARQRKLAITFVVCERENEWISSTLAGPLEPDQQFNLHPLREAEAISVIKQLERANELGTLAPLAPSERVARLMTRAGGHLLVALREATNDGRRFDEILEDEYTNIPSDDGRRAYLAVCTLFQFGVPTRAGILSRATGVPLADLGVRVLVPSRGVITESSFSPSEQARFSARHRVIAEVTFRRALRDSHSRAVQIMNLLRHIDPGYRDDEHAFRQLVKARWLRDLNIDGADMALIYQEARRLRPTDAYLVQQQGLSLRFSDRARSSQLLRDADSMAPNDLTIMHSQGLLRLDEAKEESNPKLSATLLADAEATFRNILRKQPTNSAPYVTLVGILLLRAERATDPMETIAYLSEAESLLDSAFAKCPITSQLLDSAAQLDVMAGRMDAAEDDYKRATAVAGSDIRIWLTYSRFSAAQHGPTAAVSVLEQALDSNPTQPLINHELAKYLEQLGPTHYARARRAYEYAVAEPVRGPLPELDFAIFLFRVGDFDAADDHFGNLAALDLPMAVKQQPRGWIESNGSHTILDAEVMAVNLRTAWVQVVGIPKRVFIDPHEFPSGTRKGDWVRVAVCFNFMGPRAKYISPV